MAKQPNTAEELEGFLREDKYTEFRIQCSGMQCWCFCEIYSRLAVISVTTLHCNVKINPTSGHLDAYGVQYNLKHNDLYFCFFRRKCRVLLQSSELVAGHE